MERTTRIFLGAGVRVIMQSAILLGTALGIGLWSIFARRECELAVGGPAGTLYFMMAIAAVVVLPSVVLGGAFIGAMEWRGKPPLSSLQTVLAESLTSSLLAAFLVHGLSSLPGTIRTFTFSSWLAILVAGVSAYSIITMVRRRFVHPAR